MNIDKIPVGDAPDLINVIIEIPALYGPVKYEIDKDSGAIMVDRFLAAPMYYPANYGFVPHTLAGDGDPLDVLVVTSVPLVHGCVVPSKPVGVLKMSDEAGEDYKILAVPAEKLCGTYSSISSYEEFPSLLLERINHFFEHYKKLEPGKWVKLNGWEGPDVARKYIMDSIETHNNSLK